MAKKQFKAESKKLLDMMINSIYTHKEIFLREIISNASDAIDKLCYQSLTDENVGMARSDFKIRVTPDKDARTITVSDNGIGMTKEELDSNLGVIARSGSLKFKDGLGENAQEDAAIDIIGQFGVGFYSAFMVADKVTVVTRAYGSDTAYQWVSTGADGYTITETEKVVMLTAWLVWIVAIIAFLGVVEYLRDSLERQVSLEAMSDEEVRSLYASRNDVCACDAPAGCRGDVQVRASAYAGGRRMSDDERSRR